MKKNKKINKYVEIIAEYSLDLLYTKYKKHRRLEIFANKGVQCVSCHIKGTKLVKRRIHQKKGTSTDHIDLFTQDNILMTVDHKLPKCKKGSENLKNKQPMCSICNEKKGGNYIPFFGRFSWFYRLQYLINIFLDKNPKFKILTKKIKKKYFILTHKTEKLINFLEVFYNIPYKKIK